MSWAFVQKGVAHGTGGVSSITLSLTGVAVGNLLVVGMSANDPSSLTFGLSDGVNTYTAGGSMLATGAGTNIRSRVWWTKVTTGGSLTLTLTVSSPVVLELGAVEFSAAPGATFSVQTTQTTQDGSSPSIPTAGTIAFSGTKQLLVFVTDGDSEFTTNQTAGSGFTLGNQLKGTGGSWYSYNDQYALNKTVADTSIVATFGQFTPHFSCVGMTFIETPAAPTTGGPALLAAM